MNNNTRSVLAMRYIARALRVLRYGGEMPVLPDGVSYELVFTISKLHSLAGSVWYVIEPAVRAQNNEALIRAWEKQRATDFAKNLVQSAEFSALTAEFADAKIPFLPMKGFLFKELWARPEHRTMSDMDFLVKVEDMPRVRELLVARGYTPELEDGEVHDSFNKPPYLHVEIHRSLFRGDEDSFDKWVQREDNPYWYVMRPHDFLAFVVGHIHKHFVSGGCGGRSLFDVYLYLTEKGDALDGELLRSVLEEKKLWQFYEKLLHLVYFWYGDGYPFTTDKRYIVDGEPSEELAEMEYFIIMGGAYGSEKNRVEYALERRSKLSYILKIAFPSPSSIKYLYPAVKKCPMLLPFAYPYRWIAYLFNGKVKRFCKYIFGKKEK